MTDLLLDDVKALLDKDFADDRILIQICRACENNEVISNYEKNYVARLVKGHLKRKPSFALDTNSSSSSAIQDEEEEEESIIPDVVIPQVQHQQQTQSVQRKSKRKFPLKLKNKKTMSGIAGLVLVMIIASSVSFGIVDIGILSPTAEDPPVITPPVTPPPPPPAILLSIQTDIGSYNRNDLISISGVSDTTGTVNISISDASNQSVWSETVPIKRGGQFSTLTIAGGTGWEESGIYTIKVDNTLETKSTIFSFAG